MHRSIATVSLSGTLREKLEAISAAGFEGIELFENDFIHFKGSAPELRQMCADLGLRIDLFQPFRDFEGMPEALFRKNLERAERKFDLMQALGAELMLCCSNTSPQLIDDPALAAAQLHELAERAARRGLRVGFEALAWGRATHLYGQAWDIVQRADHPHLGLILDSFHTLSLRDDPSAIARIPGDRIFFLQMADAPWMQLDVLHWARHHRNFPGQGQLPVVEFFQRVLESGYQGPLSLEIFNDVFRGTPNRRIAVDAMRSLLYLESEVRKLRTQASPGTALPAQRPTIELFDPPPEPELSGFSFLEFAAMGESAAALGVWLERLGFERCGRHRSKSVLLYRQGGVHLIVNAQPGSVASQRFAAHGPSVCAWGLRTPDPEAAVQRATAMRSQRYDGPIGPSEMHVPAVVVPGGNLAYFVPDALGETGLYEVDFELQPGPAGVAPAALTGIDHLGLGLALDQRDTWMLFSRAVLGLQAGDSIHIADPFGLVRNQAVFNPTRSVRLVLNASDSQRTRTAQDARQQGGAAVQHIAFHCTDLVAAVHALRARGVAFVPVSDNYYDDLPTRLDLDPGLLQSLREAGILYDASADGAYLHIYTESFEGRFFFEFVQRIGGYDGHGGLNASARMVAQVDDPGAH
ncbi:MAG: sugar phosphate isomerase/epimerase and 4-hydroxyphenylpyruvate domain-containing protein [Curvibacter sp.]|nr:sugar phosphate isomerase/epimerase and 4-hydroxyphenylpyruvate domain-containing protein [Curvibacter sp.]